MVIDGVVSDSDAFFVMEMKGSESPIAATSHDDRVAILSAVERRTGVVVGVKLKSEIVTESVCRIPELIERRVTLSGVEDVRLKATRVRVREEDDAM